MYRTAYRTADVDGLEVFYRYAGPPDAPVILLLHGFPSSSRMWQPLLDRLAGPFRLVAPDYPGFGHSDAPSHTEFAYTFDHLAAVIGRFTEVLGLRRYTLVVQDYGGPVGFRLAIAHPGRLDALMVQNAVAHEDGLGRCRVAAKEKKFSRSAASCASRSAQNSRRVCHSGHVGTSPNAENYDPDLWTDESSPSSAGPASRTSRPTCSTTTAPTSRATPPGRTGSASTSRHCWSYGAATTRRSKSRRPRPSAGRCPPPRCTSSTPATSPSTSSPTRSRT